MGSPALAGALVAAVVLAGAGLWAGISISCEEKYKRECRSFDANFPTISMLMHHPDARRAMRGCFATSSVLNLASDLGLADALAGGRLSGAGAACTVLSAVAAVGSFLALLICIGTNPRGAPHITACVTWAFLRIVWGCLLLRALVDATRGSAFTMLRVLAGGALQRPVAVTIFERFGVGKQ